MPEQQQVEATRELAADAIEQARTLLGAEIELVKDDLRRTVRGAAGSAVASGVAGVATVAGVEALVVSAAVAGRRDHPARAAILGLGLLALAAAAALFGRARLPASPLRATERRVASDLRDVAQRAAA